MNLDVSSSRAASDRVVAACRAHRSAYHTFALAFAALISEGHHVRLGYAKAADYAADVLDLEPRAVAELLRFGRRLPHLPTLSRALDAGELDWTKAREILRIATGDNEAAWVERAKTRTCRQLERDIAAAPIGGAPPATNDAPDDALPPAGPARRRVVFEMEAPDEERLRRALALLRAQTDLRAHEAEDGALLAAMADAVIRRAEDAERPAAVPASAVGAPPDDDEPTHAAPPPAPAAPLPATGARYRVVLEHCPTCATTTMRGRDVSETIVEEANCDTEILDMRPGPAQGHVTRTIPPATRRMVLHRAGWACEVPGCTRPPEQNPLWLDVHHSTPRADGGGHALRNLGALCGVHHRATHAGYLAVERLPCGSSMPTGARGPAPSRGLCWERRAATRPATGPTT